MNIYWFLCLSLFCTTLGASPISSSAHKEDVARQVYQRITKAVQDSRKAPRFAFILNEEEPYYNAYYNPKDNSINLGEGIYDLTVEFGADSLNALALVLGHELAHYYKDHDWGMAFGTANTDTEIASAIYELELSSEQRAKLEAEADYFGALFGYLAGYNTLDVGPAFYQKLYERLGIEEDIEGYPSMQDRMQICKNSRERLQGLIPLLDAAQRAALTGQYRSAAAYFDYVLHEFPGRGIYYNAGTALAYEALDFYEPSELRFIHPFAWEGQTRLKDLGRRSAGTSNKRLKREALLKEAETYFKKALHLDDQYLPAMLHLGLVYHLLGEPDFALAYIGKVERLAETGSLLAAYAQIAKGILWASQGVKEVAKQSFEAAAVQLPEMAARNLKALKQGSTHAWMNPAAEQKLEAPLNTEEYIADARAEDFAILLDLYEATAVEIRGKGNRPTVHLFHFRDTSQDFRLLAWEEHDEKHHPIAQSAFLETIEGYSGESARGIRIGAAQEAVRQAYGEPARKQRGLQVDYWFYENTAIVFKINAAEQVAGWMLYMP